MDNRLCLDKFMSRLAEAIGPVGNPGDASRSREMPSVFNLQFQDDVYDDAGVSSPRWESAIEVPIFTRNCIYWRRVNNSSGIANSWTIDSMRRHTIHSILRPERMRLVGGGPPTIRVLYEDDYEED